MVSLFAHYYLPKSIAVLFMYLVIITYITLQCEKM